MYDSGVCSSHLMPRWRISRGSYSINLKVHFLSLQSRQCKPQIQFAQSEEWIHICIISFYYPLVTVKRPTKNKESCNHNKMLILLKICNPLCLNRILNVPLSWNPICIHGFFILWNRWQLFLCRLTFNSECNHFFLLNLCSVKTCYTTGLLAYCLHDRAALQLRFKSFIFKWLALSCCVLLLWLGDIWLTITTGHIWTCYTIYSYINEQMGGYVMF